MATTSRCANSPQDRGGEVGRLGMTETSTKDNGWMLEFSEEQRKAPDCCLRPQVSHAGTFGDSCRLLRYRVITGCKERGIPLYSATYHSVIIR